ncbi:replication-relaxation family protein [Hamadaea sp. NPDC050747]|uniref:replication-relaxation family protein n=1 Tax=Hamadaea sp. NPDC050747 TaxID=3155789 RepID=UPI0033E498CB
MQHQLTDRDWRILGWLYDHRIMTSFQIGHALFPSINVAQRRLTQLTELSLLERFRPFRLEGGSYPYHYALAHLGDVVVAATRGLPLPRRADSAARLRRVATNRNLAHRLGVNQFFTDLAGHERTHPGSRLRLWWPDNQVAAFAGPLNSKAFALPLADAVGMWAEAGRTVAFYLEHDTGTEALTVLIDKITNYDTFTESSAPAWPVLLWLHSASREAHLHKRLAGVHHTIPVATAARDRLGHNSPADAIWHLHGSAAPLRRLVELPMPDPIDNHAFPVDDGHTPITLKTHEREQLHLPTLMERR